MAAQAADRTHQRVGRKLYVQTVAQRTALGRGSEKIANYGQQLSPLRPILAHLLAWQQTSVPE